MLNKIKKKKKKNWIITETSFILPQLIPFHKRFAPHWHVEFVHDKPALLLHGFARLHEAKFVCFATFEIFFFYIFFKFQKKKILATYHNCLHCNKITNYKCKCYLCKLIRIVTMVHMMHLMCMSHYNPEVVLLKY